jgi:hypothetical protein
MTTANLSVLSARPVGPKERRHAGRRGTRIPKTQTVDALWQILMMKLRNPCCKALDSNGLVEYAIRHVFVLGTLVPSIVQDIPSLLRFY